MGSVPPESSDLGGGGDIVSAKGPRLLKWTRGPLWFLGPFRMDPHQPLPTGGADGPSYGRQSPASPHLRLSDHRPTFLAPHLRPGGAVRPQCVSVARAQGRHPSNSRPFPRVACGQPRSQGPRETPEVPAIPAEGGRRRGLGPMDLPIPVLRTWGRAGTLPQEAVGVRSSRPGTSLWEEGQVGRSQVGQDTRGV